MRFEVSDEGVLGKANCHECDKAPSLFYKLATAEALGFMRELLLGQREVHLASKHGIGGGNG